MEIPGPADVIIYMSKRPDSTEVVRVLCHSCMLKRTGDFFREILEYTKVVSKRPTIRPPSFVLDRNSFFMEPDGEGGFKGPAARTVYLDVKKGSVMGLKRQSVLAKPGEEEEYRRASMVLTQRASMFAEGMRNEDEDTSENKNESSNNKRVSFSTTAAAASGKKRVTLVDPKAPGGENVVARRESTNTQAQLQGGGDIKQGGNSGDGGLGDALTNKLGALLAAGSKTTSTGGARELKKSGIIALPPTEALGIGDNDDDDSRPPSVEGGEMADEPCSIRNEFLVQQMALDAARKETADERETLVGFHRKGVTVGKYYVKLKMLSWTEPMLLGLLEYIYTDRCHLTIPDLPLTFAAADKMMLTSFTQAVINRDLVPYVRFAMENEVNRRAILKLCQLARCKELESIQKLCESFEYEKGKTGRNVHILVFHTAKRLARHEDMFDQGFHDYLGYRFCILRDLPPPYKHGYPEECFKDPQWSRSRRSLLNTYGLVLGPPGSKSERDAKDLEYIVISRHAQGFEYKPKKPNPDEWCCSLKEEKNKDKTWRVYLFGQKIAQTCYSFFRHACALNHRPRSPEAFSLRMISGLIVGDILVEVLYKAIPQGSLSPHKMAAASTSILHYH